MREEPIPYGRQSVSEQDIQAVVEVLKSEWLTQGPTLQRFERAVAEYCGARFAVAVNSATSALHIASLAAGVAPGKLVWTTPNTFVASANCALYCGGEVDFVDIDPATYNLDADLLEQRLEEARGKGRLPDLVIPVHFAGQPCRMDKISSLAREYGFTVIEDASHAIGARYLGRPVGGCAFSDMAVFSFHPVKIITCAEGGMVLTNREDLYQKLLRLRSHGITRDGRAMTGASHGPWYYQQVELGFNYRMTDLQAALGCSQLARLDHFVAKRQELALRYDRLLGKLPLTLPWQSPDGYSSFHLYVVRVDPERTSKSRREVFEELREAKIGVNVHYIPVHTQPYYRRLGFSEEMFPEALRYYREAITLPLYPTMSEEQQDRVVSALERCFR